VPVPATAGRGAVQRLGGLPYRD